MFSLRLVVMAVIPAPQLHNNLSLSLHFYTMLCRADPPWSRMVQKFL